MMRGSAQLRKETHNVPVVETAPAVTIQTVGNPQVRNAWREEFQAGFTIGEGQWAAIHDLAGG
ncbi:MAG TPA: hypothetical protein VMU81_27590 [Acetobacteraceae bacterium]|nr:hypothetical protein [Acetobacteraceae bacterium]